MLTTQNKPRNRSFYQKRLKHGRNLSEIDQNKPQFEPIFNHFFKKAWTFYRKVLYASIEP
jgi:hypothetical protein